MAETNSEFQQSKAAEKECTESFWPDIKVCMFVVHISHNKGFDFFTALFLKIRDLWDVNIRRDVTIELNPLDPEGLL
jgi:hypothetical protein